MSCRTKIRSVPRSSSSKRCRLQKNGSGRPSAGGRGGGRQTGYVTSTGRGAGAVVWDDDDWLDAPPPKKKSAPYPSRGGGGAAEGPPYAGAKGGKGGGKGKGKGKGGAGGKARYACPECPWAGKNGDPEPNHLATHLAYHHGDAPFRTDDKEAWKGKIKWAQAYVSKMDEKRKER